MMANIKEVFMKRIASSIQESGFHLYVVTGGAVPRFAYTIGLRELFGCELILAGALIYSNNDVSEIFDHLFAHLKEHNLGEGRGIDMGSLGKFSLRSVHPSWVGRMLLGALDYYQIEDVPALQVIPDEINWTLDIPDMAVFFNPDMVSAWQWLDKSWPFSVPRNSIVITNVDALKGGVITEVMRWDADQWEAFAGAGPDILQEEMREVPLGSLLGIDDSLRPIVDLSVEEGLWRSEDDPVWHSWGG